MAKIQSINLMLSQLIVKETLLD